MFNKITLFVQQNKYCQEEIGREKNDLFGLTTLNETLINSYLSCSIHSTNLPSKILISTLRKVKNIKLSLDCIVKVLSKYVQTPLE